MRSGTRNGWPLKLGLALISLAIGVAVAEVVLRLVSPGPPPLPAPRTIDPYEPNPYIVSGLPYLQTFLAGANYRAARSSYDVSYSINRHGFRSPQLPKKQGKRLVVVGDSIVEGHGVEVGETFVARLNEALDGAGWSVVSAGMQGASPLYYAANVPRYLALEPDAVLLVLYENDLAEDERQEPTYLELPRRRAPSSSQLWDLFLGDDAPDTEIPLETLIRKNLDGPRVSFGRDPQFPFVLPEDARELRWNRSRFYLDWFADELEQRRISLVVTSLALGTLVPRVPAEHRAFADFLEDRTRHWARGREVPYRSLHPVVGEAFSSLPWERVMLLDDGHPTAEMHSRFAAALRPWIEEALGMHHHDDERDGTTPAEAR